MYLTKIIENQTIFLMVLKFRRIITEKSRSKVNEMFLN